MPQKYIHALGKCVHRITVSDVQNAKTLHRGRTIDVVPHSGGLQQSVWMMLPHFITTDSPTHNDEQKKNKQGNNMSIFQRKLE